jgi:hypothetical protein
LKLESLIKVALDELRMQMLGVQVLFGFQFQAIFQQGFDEVSALGRYINAAGLALMVVVLGCLIAVPCQHRIVEHGMSTVRIQRVATRFADLALLPFAVGVGCALFVPMGRAFGAAAGAAAAIAATVFASAVWYGLGFALHRCVSGTDEAGMKTTSTPLHTRIDHMLTEARVILPGAQAILGFQLIVTMTPAFDQLPNALRMTHVVALASILLTIILLIAPAAVHRIAFGGRDDPLFYSVGSALLTWTLAPFAIGVCCDFYLAMTRLLESEWLARSCAAALLLLLVTLWYLMPLILRSHTHHTKP